MRHTAATVIIGTFVVGCASTGENLQRETARSIGGNIRDADVAIFDIDRSASNVKWKATAQGGNYECSADDMVRRVHCVKIVTSPQKSEAPIPIPTPSPAQVIPTATAPAKPLSMKEAQATLNQIGFKAGAPDGIAGPTTIKAIKEFQRAKGIPQTGQLDSATDSALRTR